MRRHTGEVVACVFVESMEMRSTCAECRSLCVQCREHFSGGRDGGRALSEQFTVGVRVCAVVSEVLRANQDSSFLECFLQVQLLLSEARRRETRAHKTLGPAFFQTHAVCKLSGTARRFTIDETTTIDASFLLLLHPHAAPCTTHHHDWKLDNPTYTPVAFRAHCKRIAFTRHPPQLNSANIIHYISLV